MEDSTQMDSKEKGPIKGDERPTRMDLPPTPTPMPKPMVVGEQLGYPTRMDLPPNPKPESIPDKSTQNDKE